MGYSISVELLFLMHGSKCSPVLHHHIALLFGHNCTSPTTLIYADVHVRVTEIQPIPLITGPNLHVFFFSFFLLTYYCLKLSVELNDLHSIFHKHIVLTLSNHTAYKNAIKKAKQRSDQIWGSQNITPIKQVQIPAMMAKPVVTWWMH